jgi:hypothetical protein
MIETFAVHGDHGDSCVPDVAMSSSIEFYANMKQFKDAMSVFTGLQPLHLFRLTTAP